MAKTLETSFSIGKKKVTVIFDLYFYSEKEYKKDFKDFMDYQLKRSKEDHSGLDWKFYSLKAKDKPIGYPEFLISLASLFPKVVKELLRQRPDVMVSDEDGFKVRFILFRVSKRSWYFEGQPEVEIEREKYNEWFNDVESDPVEQATYVTSGTFLIQSIVAPWIYRRKIDYTYLYRFLTHEFEHHRQKMLGWFVYEEKLTEKLKREVPKVPNYRLTYIYQTILNLIFEGTADFVTIANRPIIDIHMDWIRKFEKDLDLLTTMAGKKQVDDFWINNLSHGVFAGGSYYCGKIMCFIIELMFVKAMEENATLKKDLLQKGTYKPVVIRLADQRELALKDLDNIMSNSDLIYVTNPPEEIHRMAYNEIKACGSDFRKFLALYEKACNALGLSRKNMIITQKKLDELVNKALLFYEQFSEAKRKEMYQKAESAIKAIQRGDKL